MNDKIRCVGLARKIEVVGRDFVQRKLNITLYLDDGQVGVEHPRDGKLYFVIQTADARAFFQFDFCATLLLDLLAHDSAPFWGWILYSQKGKYLCPIGAQQISCF